MLAEYNDVAPGAAERIFAIFEKQAHHRMDLERTVIRSDVRRSWAGLVVGAILSTGVIGLGYVLVLSGHPVEGAAVVGVDIVGLVSCFVIGTTTRKNERVEKRRELEKRPEAG